MCRVTGQISPSQQQAAAAAAVAAIGQKGGLAAAAIAAAGPVPMPGAGGVYTAAGGAAAATAYTVPACVAHTQQQGQSQGQGVMCAGGQHSEHSMIEWGEVCMLPADG